MKTPSKARARRRAKTVPQDGPAKRRRARASPAADYTHPLNQAMGRSIRAWRVAHRLKSAGVARLARLSRDTLAEIERGKAWYSWSVMAGVCDAMGFGLLDALMDALRRCGRLRREKCRV